MGHSLLITVGDTHSPNRLCYRGVWYLAQGMDEFDRNFNLGAVPEDSKSTATVAIDPAQVGAVADALRQLDSLRQDGLMSEYEFEQKRRQLLDRIA